MPNILVYKNRLPMYVINYRRVTWNEMAIAHMLKLSDIKSIYINESVRHMAKYAPLGMPLLAIEKLFGCAVFIETYDDGIIRPNRGKGVRAITLDGYSLKKEFFSPDYSIMPLEPDYRRTLYWNPSVKTDNNGKAKVQFYNNSSCKTMSISAETINSNGIPGFF